MENEKWVKTYDSVSGYPTPSGLATDYNPENCLTDSFEKFTYNKDSDLYVCDSITIPGGDVWKNVTVGFENGILVSLSITYYDSHDQLDLTEAWSIDDTPITVTLPNVAE